MSEKAKEHHWAGECPNPDKYFGFLYEIICTKEDIAYIGRKSFLFIT